MYEKLAKCPIFTIFSIEIFSLEFCFFCLFLFYFFTSCKCFALKFSQPLRASVRIFISYRAARSIVSALQASIRHLEFSRPLWASVRNWHSPGGAKYLSCFALEFSRPLWASVRSFVDIRKVVPNDLDLDLDFA